MSEIFEKEKNTTDVRKVVNVENVSKSFRLHTDRSQSFKESFLRGFRKSKPELFWALKDVSFDVKEGKTLGIIGENGSGKSTMLKILTGVYKPTTGSVNVEGKVSGLLELGAGFHPELTGRENVYLNASILGMRKREIDDIFEEIVDFSEIRKFIDSPVKHYSSGMFVRLGFAVAINVNPDILVIDEVLAVGDEHFQRKCNEKILQFKKQKKTIIIVSHSLEELRSLCDEAVWLQNGEMNEFGEADKVIDSYLKKVNSEEEKTVEGRAQRLAQFGSRWGSGEAVIEKVSFSDAKGEKKRIFETGETMVVNIEYKCNERIEKPVFGFAIHTDKGFHVTGPNTRLSGDNIDHIEGKGSIEYRIESLPFVSGKFICSAAIYDYSCLHPYDHHDSMYYFEVEQSENKEAYGLITLEGKWKTK